MKSNAKHLPSEWIARFTDACIKRDGSNCHYCGYPLMTRRQIERYARQFVDWSQFQEPERYSISCLGTTSPLEARISYTDIFFTLPDNVRITTLDHKIPRVKGGKHELDNLVIACSPCNTLKNAKYTYEEFKALKQGGNT